MPSRTISIIAVVGLIMLIEPERFGSASGLILQGCAKLFQL
jgi:hypothetical protein